MISINFTGNTLDEIVNQAGQFVATVIGGAHKVGDNAVPTIDPLPLAGESPIETGAAAAATEAVKRTRRTKAEMEAARAAGERQTAREHLYEAETEAKAILASPIEDIAEATVAPPAPAATETERAWGVGEVKAALMKVVEKDGLGPAAGGKLLARFGVKRVSELDEKTFADFIAACNAAVAA